MATIANQYDPNNPNSTNQGGSGTVMPSTSSGGGEASGGGGGAPGGGPSSGSSATPYQPPNVSQYMAANSGGGQQLSNAIQNNVQNQASQVNQSVDATQNQLNSQYEPLNSKLGQGQQVAQTAFKDPQSLLDAYNTAKTQLSNQPLTSGQQAAQPNQQNLDTYNQFQQLNNGGYNQDISQYGNTAKQGYSNLQGQLGSLNQQANAASNEMGRGQLLQQAVGQANYTPGQQTLDSLFLQGQAKQLKQNLGNIAGQTNQNVVNANSDAQAKLQALQGLSAADQSGIKNLFTSGQWDASTPGQGTGLNQIASDVGNKYTAAQAAAASSPQVAQDFASGKLSPEEIQKLGLDTHQNVWDLWSNTNPNKSQLASFVTQNALDQNTNGIGAGNAQVASSDEFGRYNALNQLAGGPNGLQTSIFGGAQAAGGGYNPYSLNQDMFNNAVANRAQYWQKDNPHAIANQVMNQFHGGGTFYDVNLPQMISELQNVSAGNGNIAPSQFQNIINAAVARENSAEGLSDEHKANQYADLTGTGNSNFFTPYLAPLQNYINQYGKVSGTTLQDVLNQFQGQQANHGAIRPGAKVT